MRPDDINRLLRRRPFEPFHLYILETTSYLIRRAEDVHVDRSTVTILLPNTSNGSGQTDRRMIISLLHITRLEPLSQPFSSLEL